MKKTRFTETQIVSALKRQQGGIPSKERCREPGIAEATFYDTSLSSNRLTRTPDSVIENKEQPTAIRADNGSEFTLKHFELWAKDKEISIRHIQPWKAMQHGYIERFNRLYRKAAPDAYLFFDLCRVRELTQQWIEEYNHKRPHESLGNLTLVEHKNMADEKKNTQLIAV